MRKSIMLIAAGLFLLGLFYPHGAMAADPSFLTFDNINLESSGMSQQLKKLYHAMRKAVVATSVLMTGLGGIMIALELDTARKTLWNVVLSTGLALGIANLLANLFDPSTSGLFVTSAHRVDMTTLQFSNGDSEWYDILTPFGNIWMDVCGAGAEHLAVDATKLLIILTVISTSVKISMDTLQGDKIKYLVEVIFKTACYTFLIAYWFRYPGSGQLSIMGLLVEFFELLGYTATDGTAILTNSGDTIDMRSTAGASVVQQAIAFFMKAYEASDLTVMNPITSLIVIVILGAILVLLIKGGLELFMAKIEFFTMAMVTVPLLPFVALPQTKFLFERSVGAMFNLAVKVCVCAFLSGIAAVIMSKFVAEITITDATDIPLLIQCLLVSILLYYLISKIPALTSGLLNGSPSLDGASMGQLAGKAANNAAQVGAAVASGGTSLAVNTAKGAAFGAAKAAGEVKAYGDNRGVQMGAGLIGGIGGGLNAAAGSMASGVSGLAQNALLGRNNNNTGGILSGGSDPNGGGGPRGGIGKLGIINALRQGNQLGKNFDAKEDPNDPTSKPLNLVAPGYDKNAPSVGKKIQDSFSKALDRPVMKKEIDENGKEKMVDTGRRQGLIGGYNQFKKDVRDTYKPQPYQPIKKDEDKK